jgi:hypothetical protein
MLRLRILLMTLLISTLLASPLQAMTKRPKLVVVVVIDQFRADYLLRFEKRFLPAHGKNGELGGFAYLMSRGAYFPMAQYGILQSMTCPGHATILTGAYPYQMGVPLNFWFDLKQDRLLYCAEDASYPMVGASTENHVGTAPTTLFGSTVGDELKNAGFPSRVIAVAMKDRAAIMLGGHRADLAFWNSNHEAKWVSSTFYLPDGKLPDWIQKLNQEIQPKPGETIRWTPLEPASGYSDESYRAPVDTYHLGKTFPHEVPASSKSALSLPYGMALTEQAAERAFDVYHLGKGKAPDVLALSFSSFDYIGHAFGPNSREVEEMTIQADRILAKLLNHIRRNLPGGLNDVVIALTGDHGTPPDPRWAKAHRQDAGVINEKQMTEDLEKLLTGKFGRPGDLKWINYNHDFDIFVNRKAVADRKADLAEVLFVAKEHVAQHPGVAHVFTLTDYQARRLPPGLHGEQAVHTYFLGRSGDIVIIPRPFWMIDDFDATSHLTGYNYDTLVPLVIAGPQIRPAVYPGHVRVIDLAPTLSYLLGVLPPSLSEGRVLTEAIAAPGARH